MQTDNDMILLLGGTSDTRPIATRLAEGGYRVLVSRATDVLLETGTHCRIENRSGPLNANAMGELIDRRRIRAIVDATHPYAISIRSTASRVAREKGIAYLNYVRPGVIGPDTPGVEFAAAPIDAARAAFRDGRPVLLTTGTRVLDPYVEEARRAAIPLIIRTLDHPDSLAACRRAGIPPEHIITGRGPFSVADNRRHLRDFDIGVLVTKDSGTAGGVLEKLEAARAANCRVIVVTRPVFVRQEPFSEVDSLLEALSKALSLTR